MSQGAASRNFRLGLAVRTFQAGRRLPFNLASVYVQVKLPAVLVGRSSPNQDKLAKRLRQGCCDVRILLHVLSKLCLMQKSSRMQESPSLRMPTHSAHNLLLMSLAGAKLPCQLAKSALNSAQGS